MLSFKNYIKEGIVKVNENTLNTYLAYFIKHFFDEDSVFMDLYNDKGRNVVLDRHIKDYKDWANTFDTERDNLRYYRSEEYNIDSVLDFIVGEFSSKMGAAFKQKGYESSHKIYVNENAERFIEFVSDWIENKDKHKLKLAFDSVKANIEHEIAHLIDHEIKSKKNKKQLNLKADYDTNMDSYYTSPVEFEQQVIAVIRDIEFIIKYHNEKITKQQYKEFVNRILGNNPNEKITLPKTLDVNTKREFISALKRTQPKKYRVAINKIIVELDKNVLPKLIQGGYVEQ